MAEPFKTTRKVRSVISAIRNWMVNDYSVPGDIDPGKLSATDMLAWLVRVAAVDPSNYAIKLWSETDDATKAGVKYGWLHLRGPTFEEKARQMSERHNARVLANNPLFAAAGAIEEVATLSTPEGVLTMMNERRSLARENAGRPTVEQKSRAKVKAHPDEPMCGALSMNQLLVWRHLYRIPRPGDTAKLNTDAALSDLRKVSDGNLGRAREIADEIIAYLDSRGARDNPNVVAGIDALLQIAGSV